MKAKRECKLTIEMTEKDAYNLASILECASGRYEDERDKLCEDLSQLIRGELQC